MLCEIWYHLHNLKKVENTHGGVLLLAKFTKSNFTKINTPFSQLYKRYQIAQCTTYIL